VPWDPVEKLKRYNRVLDNLTKNFKDKDLDQLGLRVFVYETKPALVNAEMGVFLKNDELYPEDLANLHFLNKIFRHPLVNTPDPEKADIFFSPFYLHAYEYLDIELQKNAETLAHLKTGKPHFLYGCHDSYLRFSLKRANPFCLLSSESREVMSRRDRIDYGKFVFDRLGFIDEKFHLITFESTIDLHPNDLGSLPLPGIEVVKPWALPRDFLYSFIGTLWRDRLPNGHIRGKTSWPQWAKLMERNDKDAFVSTLHDAQIRFGPSVDNNYLLNRSTFTLCPAGLGRWSYRLSEAIAQGSIPVILSDYYVKPFSDQLNWDSFSLTLPETSLSFVDRKSIFKNFN